MAPRARRRSENVPAGRERDEQLARLEIGLRGGLAIRHGGTPLPLRSRRAAALLAYLACAARPHPRRALAALLWGDLPETRALGNLRVVLNELRARVGEHLLVTRDAVGLDPTSDLVVDVPADEPAAFLADFALPETPAFAAWVAEQRARPAARMPERPTLPAWPTPFVGRQAELAHLGELLTRPECRLVTLLGLGGAGKTRLAVEAARSVADRFADGALFAALAVVGRGDQVASAVAEAVGLSPRAELDPRTQLREHLRGRQQLLVLDNLEQVVEGAAQLVADLLDAAPGLRVLATSRRPLDLRDEWRLPVDGLELAAATRLFAAAAERVRPDFALTPELASTVERICRLVDGVPLAVELAASWSGVYSAEQIESELARDLDFLATRARDVPDRQRSIRVIFDHTWALLEPAERAGFAALSVFRGGMDAAAVEAVAGGRAPLRALVEHGLVRVEQSGRFEIHELLRQYAAEELAGDRDAEARARERHRAHYLEMVGEQAEALRGERQHDALAAIQADLENVRVSWAGACDAGWLEGLAGAVDALALFYEVRGRWPEAEAACRRAVEVADEGEGDEAERCLGVLLTRWGRFLMHLARFEEAETVCDRALTLLRRHGDRRNQAHCLVTLGAVTGVRGPAELARERFGAAAALARDAGDGYGLAEALNWWGGAACEVGDRAEATRRWEEALEVRRGVGDLTGVAHSLVNLGWLALDRGDYAEAKQRNAEGLAIARELGDRIAVLHALDNLSEVALALGDATSAREHQMEALALARAVGDPKATALCLLGAGRALRQLGETAEAERVVLEALSLYRVMEYDSGRVRCLATLSRLAAERGRRPEARLLAGDAVALARRGVEAGGLGIALVALARSAEEAPERAAALDEALGLVQPTWAARELLDAVALAAELVIEQQPGLAAAAAAAAAEHPATPAESRATARRLRSRLPAARNPLAEMPALVTRLRGALADAAKPTRTAGASGLTAREREVADLVALGLTNRGIAERLVISEETARVHVKRILSKLGVASRAQVAVWAVRQGAATE